MLYVNVDELLLLDLMGEVDAETGSAADFYHSHRARTRSWETEAEQQRRAGST